MVQKLTVIEQTSQEQRFYKKLDEFIFWPVASYFVELRKRSYPMRSAG